MLEISSLIGRNKNFGENLTPYTLLVVRTDSVE